MIYQERRYYSPEWDGWFVRVSTVPEHRQAYTESEYFMILPWEGGRKWREQRLKALQIMERAIEMGYDPGEVFPEDFDEGYVQ